MLTVRTPLVEGSLALVVLAMLTTAVSLSAIVLVAVSAEGVALRLAEPLVTPVSVTTAGSCAATGLCV